MALFLEDDKNLVFVFLRMKIKVALGGVIHPLSPKKKFILYGSLAVLESKIQICPFHTLDLSFT